MTQVSNQTQLLAALAAQDSIIQITDNFRISSQINILYPVTLESITSDTIFTLTKDASYFAYLFRIQNGGSLTLQNIILDGNKNIHAIDNTNNRSLIYVAGGTLNLQEGSVLQNNNSYLEGGGVYFNRNESYPNTLTMGDNAQIYGCYSRTNGGGIMLAVGNALDSFHISNASRIDGNQAVNGGGIYCRGYVEGVPSILSVDEQVEITNNQVSGAGGAIYFSGYREGNSPGSVLTLSGDVLISENQANHGAGIYFYAANQGDQLVITQNVIITQNTASQNGGGCNIESNGVLANISVTNASITENTAGTGGGIYLLTSFGADVNFYGSKFTNNKAINDASGTGGGIWIKNESQDAGVLATLTDVILENNQASAHAGGMALYAGAGPFSFQMTGGTVSHNHASQDGGGFVISNEGSGTLHFHQSVFTQNSANGSGGGIFYYKNGENAALSFTMKEVIISNNTADNSGGGLRLSSGSGTLTTLLENCIISSNIAHSNNGGGIWNGGNKNQLILSGTTAVTDNSTQSGNGGGISLSETSQLLMNGGTIQNNTSGQFGGGIWNHANSITTLTGGSVTDNHASLGNDIYSDSFLNMEGTRELTNGICLATADSVVKLIHALTGTSVIQLEVSPYVMPNLNGTPIIVGESTDTYPQLSQADADAFLKPQQGFDGWDIQLNDDSTQILLTPINFHIQYENMLGAVNPNPATYTITTPTIELLPLPNLAGYRFLGWFDAATEGNRITSIPQGSSGDITLYARWEEITEYYTIAFCGNDGFCSRACNIPEPIIIRGEQEVTLPDTIPHRKAYCFRCWNTDRCGKGISYLPGDTITAVNANITLYAIWKQNMCGCPCPPPKAAV